MNIVLRCDIHPAGEPEASICCVIKGLQYRNMAAPLNALPMKASDSLIKRAPPV